LTDENSEMPLKNDDSCPFGERNDLEGTLVEEVQKPDADSNKGMNFHKNW
jgi:hypothetical protein